MAATGPGAGRASTRRVLAASMIGTAVETYDFYIYGTAASLVFGPLFFPKASASAQLLSAYATFAVAFFARPLGGAFFGHFGDRIGRKSTLVASLLLMGASTVLVAFLPGYATLGWWAPFLLCVLRFGQGFGLGGEWGGAVLLAVENAPPGRRGRFGSIPLLGAPTGFLLANGLFLILGLVLTPEQFKAWGWRLPFLASVGLVGIGLWIRLRIGETPAFEKMLAAAETSPVPTVEVFRRHPLALLGATLAVIACFAIFYISTTFALGYGVGTLKYDREAFLGAQLLAMLFMAGGIVVAGIAADRATPRQVLIAGCVGTVVVGGAMGVMVVAGSLSLVWAWMAAALLMMGLVYGPLGSYLPSLFPPQLRYTGVSIAFNIGGILGGGLAPIVAQKLSETGGAAPVGAYLAAAAVLSLCGLIPLKARYGE
ncbi:MFS transporter [Phenylobacterium sp.]|uniref:MFS transporter n=1 Tax=Phenylobacterium sp. TaxID=1871053 RepID=UPI0025F0D58F|nr:MFS transporter [Phenylobacterium sp.]